MVRADNDTVLCYRPLNMLNVDDVREMYSGKRDCPYRNGSLSAFRKTRTQTLTMCLQALLYMYEHGT